MTATERRQFSRTALELHALARIHEGSPDRINQHMAWALRVIADQAAAAERLARAVQEAEDVSNS